MFETSSTTKIEKLDYWDTNNYIKFNHKQLQNQKSKVYQPITIGKLPECSLKNVEAKAIFTLSIYEILLSIGTSVLRPAHHDTGSKGLKFQ